jgi:hypothetical protein
MRVVSILVQGMMWVETQGPMQCKQSKRQRQVWYEESASPVLHSFLQKFGIARHCWLPGIELLSSHRDWRSVWLELHAVRVVVLWWRAGTLANRWWLWVSRSLFRIGHGSALVVKNRSSGFPVVVYVEALRWKLCSVSPQAMFIISTIDTTSLRWLWALKESGSQASPRGGAESDFEARRSPVGYVSK